MMRDAANHRCTPSWRQRAGHTQAREVQTADAEKSGAREISGYLGA
jgi:hypothetical protein